MAVTPTNGAENFPVTENEFYEAVETLAVQDISLVKSSNRIYDAVYDYEVENGAVVEQAIIGLAHSQTVNKQQCDMTPHDPPVAVRYFNNWDEQQFVTTTRRDEIRKIIANKGKTVAEVEADIVEALTATDGRADFVKTRNLIMETSVTDYTETLGGTPSNMKGVIYALRDMYITMSEENTAFTPALNVASATPRDDIRIAISAKLMNLMDVGELADVFNLTKEELFGKLVIIPVSDLDKSKWYKVVVYDRKAFGRATRTFDYDYDRCASGRFTNHYLTVDRAYFYSPLFKAASLDVTAAATATLNGLITPNA